MASITVYINSPHTQIDGIEDSPAGHLWMGLTGNDGNTYYYGFYPFIDGQGKEVYHFIPGSLHNDDNSTFNYDDSVTFKINHQEWSNINEYLYQQNNLEYGNPAQDYNAILNSCVTVVYNTLSKAGIYPADLDGISLYPALNVWELNTMASDWNSNPDNYREPDPNDPTNPGTTPPGTTPPGTTPPGTTPPGTIPPGTIPPGRRKPPDWRNPPGGRTGTFFGPNGGDPWGPILNLASPIILDIAGDGVKTTNINNGTFFDLDANGFAEQTGWITGDEGLLYMDYNGDGIINDGTELFGDHTILKNGTRAQNGFQALAEFDDNHDGKIDGNDTIYSQLGVWKDTNGDGVVESGEMFTLGQLGVASLNVNYAATNTTDSSGNVKVCAGTYQTQDGRTLEMSDYNFVTDRMSTIANVYKDVPNEILQLAYLPGYGNVYDSWQAMVRDQSGTLQNLITSFSTENDPSIRINILDQILFKWTKSDTIDPTSRGGTIDARHLTVLEDFYGTPFIQGGISAHTNPGAEATIAIEERYQNLKQYYNGWLMAQTHLSDLFSSIKYSLDENGQVIIDMKKIQDKIQSDLTNNYSNGKLELGEFLNAALATGFSNVSGEYQHLSEYFSNQSRDLALMVDSVGKAVINGGDGKDSLFTSFEGNVIIKGGNGDDDLHSRGGNNVLDGGAGNDKLYAGSGNDILDGRAGDDVLYAGTGNGTFLWGKGSGNDIIDVSTYGSGGQGKYTVQFGLGLTMDVVNCLISGSNLVVQNKISGETLTIKGWFNGSANQVLNRVDSFQFDDGSSYTEEQISEMAVLPYTEGADVIYGLSGRNNKIFGGGGNDKLYAREGNDTLDGGAGDDNLYAGSGTTTFLWGKDSGNDIINAYNNGASRGADTIQLGAGITKDSLSYLIDTNGNNLVLNNKDTGESLTITGWFRDTAYQVDSFQFADGSSYTKEQISEMAGYAYTDGYDYIYGLNGRNNIIRGGGGDDVLYAGNGKDTLTGGAGNDKLYSGSGIDILDGGVGNDILYAGNGNTTFWWENGSGNDVINAYNNGVNRGKDTLQFQNLAISNILFTQNANDLICTNNQTNETVRISNWLLGGNYQVDQFQFSDGMLTATQISQKIV